MLTKLCSRHLNSWLGSSWVTSSYSYLTVSSRVNMAKPLSRPSSDMAKFRDCLVTSKHIVIITGAGVSAESGVPTFRGAGGFWRKWQAQDLATPEAFQSDPSLVWEFYHYRREVMASKHPNPGHKAIAELEKRLKPQGRRVVIITQNIDELHKVAGSENIIELHGNLFTTRCTKCGDVRKNRDSPICPALSGKGWEPPQLSTLQQCLPLKWQQEVFQWLSLILRKPQLPLLLVSCSKDQQENYYQLPSHLMNGNQDRLELRILSS